MRLAPILVAATAACSLIPSDASADDAALTAQVIRMCQQNFDGKEEPGPMLEGPAWVVLAGETLEDWRVKAQLRSSDASGQPKTVFCARSQYEKAGTYSDGSSARTEQWRVTALSWPDGLVRRKGLLTGAPPALVKKTQRGDTPRDEYGSVSVSALEQWLKGASSDVLLASFAGAAFLSPDGSTLALAVGRDKDASAQLLDWPSQALRQRIGKHLPYGFVADGRLMIPYKYETVLWDVSAGREAGKLPFSVTALSRDGTRAIGDSKRDAFWDVASGRVVSTPDDRITLWKETSAMSTDGRYACAVVADKLTLWDVTAGRAAATFDLKDVKSLNMSPNSARCAVSGDGKWMAFDVDEGLYKLGAADGSVQRLGDRLNSGCMGLSADGRWLAVGGQDAALHLWDLTLGKEVLRTPSKSGFLCQIVFSADDALLWQKGRFVDAETRTQVWDAKRLIGQAAAAGR